MTTKTHHSPPKVGCPDCIKQRGPLMAPQLHKAKVDLELACENVLDAIHALARINKDYDESIEDELGLFTNLVNRLDAICDDIEDAAARILRT